MREEFYSLVDIVKERIKEEMGYYEALFEVPGLDQLDDYEQNMLCSVVMSDYGYEMKDFILECVQELVSKKQ